MSPLSRITFGGEMGICLEAGQMVAKCGPAEGIAGELQGAREKEHWSREQGRHGSLCARLWTVSRSILDKSKLLSRNARNPLLLYTSYITPSLLAPAIYGLALTKSTPFWMFFFKSAFRLVLL